MHIVIDLYNTGLGNNGGSRTLILCAENLYRLGNDVTLYSNISSKYTWGRIDKNINMVYGEKSPQCDVIISTSPKSVEHTLRSDAKRKFYYIRGYEIFWCRKSVVHDGYKKLKCIVNSEWLKKFLNNMGIESHIVYPGLDFDIFYNKRENRDDVVGGLYHNKLTTKRYQDVEKIAQSLNKNLYLLNKDIVSPSNEEILDFYNKIKVWVSPTELEGLHNPPMESSLCGCSLVCTDHEMSGMSDYAIHEETALVYKARDINMACKYVKKLMENPDLIKKLNVNMVNLLKSKIGDRQTNMKKMLEIIS